MKASWRILALAGTAVLAAGAAACTVTTSNDLDAGDLFDDAGTTTSDSGTTDSGTTTDDPNAACRNFIQDDGGLVRQTFDTTGTACDTCMDDNCCAPMEACFQDPTGQCEALEECLTACASDSDPATCDQTCADGFATDGGNPPADLHNTWAQCQQTSCATACP